MRVSIKSDNTLKVVSGSLKNKFSSRGIKVTKKKSNADLIILLNHTEEKQNVFDTKMAVLKIDVLLTNKKGETVYQSLINSSGASVSSYSKASELARIEAAKKIKLSEVFTYLQME